jgi:Transposase IS116/IS110/IS902 family
VLEATDFHPGRTKALAPALADDTGHHAVQAIPGVGPVLASISVVEIGEVSRFATA